MFCAYVLVYKTFRIELHMTAARQSLFAVLSPAKWKVKITEV